MKTQLVDLRAQYASIKEEMDEAIGRVVSSGNFILGEEVRRFEEEFAAFCGVQHAVGVASGTAALHLALRAVGIGPGDEVITSTFTFIATAEAILYCGARPVFVDIDPRTYNLDPDHLDAVHTAKTKAVIPVYLYGQPAGLDTVLAWAERNGVRVVGDAAQAHGARYGGQPIGSLGDAACFSFYPGKNLGAYGDGGAVVTDNPEIAERVRLLRNHGRKEKYTHLVPGYGERLDALQAAVLRVKLGHLADWNESRRRVAQAYSDLLSGQADFTLPYGDPAAYHVYHLYVLQCDRRDDVQPLLKSCGVETGVHYPIPLHLQPAFADLGYEEGDLPVSEQAASRVLSIPMYPELTDEQVRVVCEALDQAVSQ